MPQNKQEQYEDALGSIFDFIFTESQKPLSKTKPVKVTGIDGTSELVDALAAAVENPAMYVNENTLEAFREFSNIDLAKIKLDDRGGQIKFNLNSLGDIIKDPGKYIDAQFTKAEAIRKSQRMAATGEAMMGVVAGSWAAKRGLDYETRRALAGVGIPGQVPLGFDPERDQSQRKRRPDELRQDLMYRADELMDKHFIQGTRSLNRWTLMRKFGQEEGDRIYKQYENARKAYQTGKDKDRAAIFSSPGITDLYSVLEAEEIREKAKSVTDPEKKMDYMRASRFVDNVSVVGGLKRYAADSKKAMETHRAALEKAKKSGASKSVINQHKQRIRELRSDYDMAMRYQFAGRMGTFEGHWNTAKDLFVDGNLLANVINGQFFKPERNQIAWLQPADPKKREREFTIVSGRGKKKTSVGKVEFLVAKEGRNKFLDAYSEAMVPLYYLSPVTMVKSLSTGEIFAYRAYLVEKLFKKKMGSVLGANIASFDMEKFMTGVLNGQGQAYINSLQGNISGDLIKKMQKFVGQQERLNKLAYNFSAISRFKNDLTKKVNGWIEKKLGGSIKEIVGKKLLQVGFIQKFGKEAINSWMLKGGLNTLVKGVVTAALQAIGFSIAGPIGNVVVTALTWVATNTIMKMVKPILKYGVQAGCMVAFGLFAIPLLFFAPFHLLTFGKYAHVAPNEIVECEAYTDLGLKPIEEELVCCDGKAFEKVQGLPSYADIPSQAKDYFNTNIQSKLTPELAEVYTKAQEATGIPCEIIMGIHEMEGGMSPSQSLFDGAPLHGDLLADAIAAMEHLKSKMGMAGVPAGSVQLTYEKLVVGLADYNGPGNANCSTSPMTGAPRPTRWRDSGKCPVPYGFDHIYPVNWISPEHTNMDLIYCMDTVEFTCNREATDADYDFIKDRYERVMSPNYPDEIVSPPEGFIEDALNYCFAGSFVCNPADTDNNTRKYPLFKRTGVLTTAILAHQSSLVCDASGGGGGGGGGGGVGGGGGGGVTSPSQCRDLPEYTGGTSKNPYGSNIVKVARTITSNLGQGHWNYFNRPLSGMPDKYSHNQGRLKWNQDKFINNRDDTDHLSQDRFSLYWCTWLTHDSYVEGGVPEASSVFNTFKSGRQLSQFISYGNGYDFVCNGPGVVKGISPGDVIFYTWLAPNEAGYGTAAAHVGIVESVSSNSIRTYESNTTRPSITLTVNPDGSVGKQADLYTLGFGRYR